MDTWRAVDLMLRRYGEKAEYQAGLRGDHALSSGDKLGWDHWLKVTMAIAEFSARNENLESGFTNAAGNGGRGRFFRSGAAVSAVPFRRDEHLGERRAFYRFLCFQ